MSDFDYDLFVIGAGSGGTRAARIAAGYGARVAVAEERFLGGTCVNVGCIPKKLFVYASHFAEDFEDAAGFGWRPSPGAGADGRSGAPAFDWPTLVANKDREIERLNGIYRGLIEGAGARLYDARATIAGPHAVSVDGSTVSARHILVATGGEPTLPDLPGIEHAIRSDDVFYLDRLPERLIVVGGGYIAVELAGVFAGLGVGVTQLYRGPLFLRGFDDDIRRALAEEMRKRGVDLRFDTNVAAIERRPNGAPARGGIRAVLAGRGAPAAGAAEGAGAETLEADLILYATGRHPNTAGLGLENAGVATAPNGAVLVDAWSRSNVEHIFAVGDVTDRINLTPVAIREGHCFAETVFNDNPISPDHEDVPTAVFSQPAIGTCGLTEAEATARYPEVDVYVSSFRPLKHTLSGRDQRSVMKLLVDAATDRVVGCHLLDPDAAEIVQGVGIAMKCGATKAQFDRTMALHPTAAEEIVTMRSPARRLRRGEAAATEVA